MQINWDDVRPLIVDEHTAGDTLFVLFRCPVSGTEVPASAERAPAPAVEPASPLRALGDDARAVFGSRHPERWTVSERKQAALDAFRSVASWFVWDPRHRRWIAADAAGALTDLQKQVVAAPLTAAWDHEVAARILAEVAGADPPITEAERAVLAETLPARWPGVQALLAMPPLTDAELGEVTAGEVRVTCVMLGWVMVYGDGAASEARVAALGSFATRLGLSEADAQRAQRVARAHLFEAALDSLYVRPTLDRGARDTAYAFADAIGMPRADAEAVEARFLKRAAADVPPPAHARAARRHHVPPEVSRRSELWGLAAVLVALLVVLGVWWMRTPPTPAPTPAPAPAPTAKCTNEGHKVDLRGIDGPTGVSVDQTTGQVAWKRAKKDGAAFAYVRANAGTKADTEFATTWQRTADCELPRGAVLVYVPGVAVEDQVQAFLGAIGKDHGELPPVIDLQQGYVAGAKSCAVVVGEAAELALRLERELGRTPVIRVGGSFWNDSLACASVVPVSVLAMELSHSPLWVLGGSEAAAFTPWTAWTLFSSDAAPEQVRFNGDEAALKAWK